MTSTYHTPVLLEASLAGLGLGVDAPARSAEAPGRHFVDVTFGGGGHSRAILERMGPADRLWGFDQDPDARAQVPADPRFTLIPQNFRHARNFLRHSGVSEVAGLLADLGVSSHQFDEAARGFSTRFEAPLDMRMNPQSGLSAAQLIEGEDVRGLAYILATYGEIPRPMRVAQAIQAAHAAGKLTTTTELVHLIRPFAPPRKENQFAAQVFQALRMAVNDELAALRELLMQCVSLMPEGGRLVVISYHSLEDRLVKHFMRSGNFEDAPERDLKGRLCVPFTPLGRKAVTADEAEQLSNPRSRSARLRVAARTDWNPAS